MITRLPNKMIDGYLGHRIALFAEPLFETGALDERQTHGVAAVGIWNQGPAEGG